MAVYNGPGAGRRGHREPYIKRWKRNRLMLPRKGKFDVVWSVHIPNRTFTKFKFKDKSRTFALYGRATKLNRKRYMVW